MVNLFRIIIPDIGERVMPPQQDLRKRQANSAGDAASQDFYLALLEVNRAAFDADGDPAFMATVRQQMLQTCGVERVFLATASRGSWVVTPADSAPPPTDLLAEVLDQEQTITSGSWIAVPLDPRAASAEVLVIDAQECPDVAGLEPQLATWSDCIRSGLEAVRARGEKRRRIERLEAILEIANHWNRNTEMEALLVDMAEAATRLLDADRASIFLWDKKNHTLVARPALGVEGGELRTPDDRGVVGHVVQTGRTKRVDVGIDQEQIDRHVDLRLGYETRTLVCVPLVTGSGELIGAFEVLNKNQGNFSDDDETALEELASHAATALENTQHRQELLRTRRHMADEAAGRVQLIGDSSAIEALRSTIRRVADTDLAVLILGENGTGKEVVAQMIHYLSRRRDQPFIAVNCAAISESLLESELFGHEKGAFTDAHEARQGKFELAAGGDALPRRNRRPQPRGPSQTAARARGKGRSSASEVRRPYTPMRGSSRRRTRIWLKWSATARFGRTFSSASTW